MLPTYLLGCFADTPGRMHVHGAAHIYMGPYGLNIIYMQTWDVPSKFWRHPNITRNTDADREQAVELATCMVTH